MQFASCVRVDLQRPAAHCLHTSPLFDATPPDTLLDNTLVKWLYCLLLLKLSGYQMESGRAHCIGGGYREGRLGSVPSYRDSLELIAKRYGSHPTICQPG